MAEHFEESPYFEALKAQYADAVLKEGRGRAWLMKEAGITESQARALVSAIRANRGEVSGNVLPSEYETAAWEESQGKGRFTGVVSEPVKTLDDLYRVAKVDRDVWEVDKWKATAWNVGVKLTDFEKGEDGKPRKLAERPEVLQLYRVQADFVKKVENIAILQLADRLIEQIKQAAPIIHVPRSKGDTLVVLHLPDPHIGIVASAIQYSLEDAVKRHTEAVEALLEGTRGFNAEHILLPLGHDMMQVDRVQMTKEGTVGYTSSGTPVGFLGTYPEMFLAAELAGSLAIKRAAQLAPTTVTIIPGNHDEASSFSLGRVWYWEFHKSDGITVRNSGASMDFFEYGVNAFMFTHGKECPFDMLPQYFATAAPKLWGRSTWREVLTGHLHCNKSRTVGDYVEGGGCITRISPSLCPFDTYHRKKMFKPSIPAAQAFVYAKDGGFIHMSQHNVMPPFFEEDMPALDRPFVD